MADDKQIILYITKNKIWARDFSTTQPKVTEYQWDGQDPTEAFKSIAATFKTDKTIIVLGNKLSYVVVLGATPEQANREKILEEAKALIPEDLSDYNFDWKQVVINPENNLNTIQVIATPKAVINTLSYAAKASNLEITAIVPVSVILAEATKNIKVPHLILWDGQEKLGIVALAGTAYFSEAVSDNFQTKITELTSFTKDKFNFHIDTIMLSWQQNPPNFTQGWKVQKVTLDPLNLAASNQPSSGKDSQVLEIKPIENPTSPQPQAQKQASDKPSNPGAANPSTHPTKPGFNKKLLLIFIAILTLLALFLGVILI